MIIFISSTINLSGLTHKVHILRDFCNKPFIKLLDVKLGYCLKSFESKCYKVKYLISHLFMQIELKYQIAK